MLSQAIRSASIYAITALRGLVLVEVCLFVMSLQSTQLR
jgi:hypothetical protein